MYNANLFYSDMKHRILSRWLAVVGIMLVCLPAMAQKRTLSGYVMDAASKETLIGATVIDRNTGKGCATNSYGFYTLTLDQGAIDLQVSYVGYTQETLTLDLKENLSLNFTLASNTTLDEVVVEGTRATDMTLGLSTAMVSWMYSLTTLAYSLAMAAASFGEEEVAEISSMRVFDLLVTEIMPLILP